MEWNGLGDLLGRSLAGAAQGTSRGLDTLLEQQERNKQREFEKNKRLDEIRLQEQMRQRAAQQKEQQNNQQNQLFSQLLTRAQNGEITPDMLNALAAEGGINPQMLTAISGATQKNERNQLNREKLDLQKRKYEGDLGYKYDAPAIKEANEYFSDLAKKHNSLSEQIGSYDNIVKLAKSGKLNVGPLRRFMDKVGIAELGDNPETETAKKLMENLVLLRTQSFGSGKQTVELMKREAEANPNLFQSPRGIEATARVAQLGVQAEKILSDNAAKIKKKSNGRLNPNSIEMLNEKSSHEIEKLHNKQRRIAESVSYPIDLDDVLKEDLPLETIKELPSPIGQEDDPIQDEETGYRFWSDGKKWRLLTKGR